MAEIVEYRVGKTLGEIDVLIKFGILDEAEAREIINKREEYEYSLRRRTNDKLRHLKYIKFEWNLLSSIEQYQKTISSKTDDEIFKLQAKKLDEIIKSRVAHINFLYRKLIMKNQFDKRLWSAYIEFAKQRRMFSRVSALYWRLLRVMNNEESLWLDAADYEITTTKDLNTARKLLVLALRHNPGSKLIKDKLKSICDIPALAHHEEKEIEEDASCATRTQSAKAATKKSNMDLLYECYDSKGLDETRYLYESMESHVKSQTLSLYVGMIQVETWHLSKDKSEAQLNRIRAIYDKALLKFGKHRAKLWYEYIQFEHQFAKNLEDFERINQLYTRAQATLQPSQVERVIEKYTLMQTKSGSRVDVEYSDYSDLDDN